PQASARRLKQYSTYQTTTGSPDSNVGNNLRTPVRSGLAGYYICEAIHETGILVALDLASLTFAILCRERGTHGLPGCNDRMRCPCKLFPATWRCGLLLVVGHISYPLDYAILNDNTKSVGDIWRTNY
ncbi:hypothetical protein P692DRAFT_2015303, partial [Suillus brevipes Sb2]